MQTVVQREYFHMKSQMLTSQTALLLTLAGLSLASQTCQIQLHENVKLVEMNVK